MLRDILETNDITQTKDNDYNPKEWLRSFEPITGYEYVDEVCLVWIPLRIFP